MDRQVLMVLQGTISCRQMIAHLLSTIMGTVIKILYFIESIKLASGWRALMVMAVLHLLMWVLMSQHLLMLSFRLN